MATEVSIVVWCEEPPMEEDMRLIVEEAFDGHVLTYEEEEV